MTLTKTVSFHILLITYKQISMLVDFFKKKKTKINQVIKKYYPSFLYPNDKL